MDNANAAQSSKKTRNEKSSTDKLIDDLSRGHFNGECKKVNKATFP